MYEMYVRAGLITRSTPSVAIPRGEATTAHSDSSRSAAIPASSRAPAADSAPVGARAALARRSLEQAERRVGMRQPSSVAPADSTMASDAQLGLIARLVNELLRRGDETRTLEVATTLNALGARFGIDGLADLRSKAQLRSTATHLTKLQATRLIDSLKALDGTLDTQAT